MSRHYLLLTIFVASHVISSISGTTLSRCCRDGSSQFARSGACSPSGAQLHLNTPSCRRTHAVCCLKSKLDVQCSAGRNIANGGDECPSTVPMVVGGAVKKQCCDCCQLAKDVVSANHLCQPPDGVGERCRNSFLKCCGASSRATGVTRSPPGRQYVSSAPSYGGRWTPPSSSSASCTALACDHRCVLESGRPVCQCHDGYELESDRRSCRAPVCTPACQPSEHCTKSGVCVSITYLHSSHDMQRDASSATTPRRTALACPKGYAFVDDNAYCTDVDECSVGVNGAEACTGDGVSCMNALGTFHCVCAPGYSWSDGEKTCLDVDECLLLMDDCTEGSNCINMAGTFRCMRVANCGTGYRLDTDKSECLDVNECQIGTHNCAGKYRCRNTMGSFRCVLSTCPPGTSVSPSRMQHAHQMVAGECRSVDCSQGYLAARDDQNECLAENMCRSFETCINTPGAYKCESKDDVCVKGFAVDSVTGLCMDVNECSTRQHTCQRDSQCLNTDGSYRCRCDSGYEFNTTTLRCEDLDECERFQNHVCSFNAVCENTVGSFECHCNQGYRLAADKRGCEDVNECTTGEARCEQRCTNVPGSYQCICQPGYTLDVDGHRCNDIDECTEWSGDSLCMGACVNTPGSYRCTCPRGYRVMDDHRTCKDVDECQEDACPGDDRICVNTLGSHKCHRVRCPTNYVQDEKYRNRCNRVPLMCSSSSPGAQACMRRPVHISFEHIALPRSVSFGDGTTTLQLFTLKGPESATTELRFELKLIDARAKTRPDGRRVRRADRDDFLLQKGARINSAIIGLRHALDGEQEVELEVNVKMYHAGMFGGRYVAILTVHVSDDVLVVQRHSSKRTWATVQDGYFCLQECRLRDVACATNNTRSITYQYATVPSRRSMREPIEVTRIRAENLSGEAFSVRYEVERANAREFRIDQRKTIGILNLHRALRGPQDVTVRVSMDMYNGRHRLLSHHVAIIVVHVEHDDHVV